MLFVNLEGARWIASIILGGMIGMILLGGNFIYLKNQIAVFFMLMREKENKQESSTTSQLIGSVNYSWKWMAVVDYLRKCLRAIPK